MTYEQENQLLCARIAEHEHTLDHFSREMRENIGQLLNFTKMNMFPIEKFATDTRQKELIERTKQLLDRLIGDVHNMGHGLNSDYVRVNGLPQALQEEMHFLLPYPTIASKLDVTGNYVGVAPEKELLVYRIAREALHNIARHAAATEVSVHLAYAPQHFTMTIADNGNGFDQNTITERNTKGLVTIKHRARLLSGWVHIESPIGVGTTLKLHVNDYHLPA